MSGLLAVSDVLCLTCPLTEDTREMINQHIVMDDVKVLNPDGLRYDEEFAKHKILDAIGDLYCIGHAMLAAYSAFRSGHALNNQLLRALLAQPDAYEIVSFADEQQAPAGFGQLGCANTNL